MMLKQNDKIKYFAQSYTSDGTVGNAENYTVFVPQTIVGETAVVKVNYVKKNIVYADAEQILKPSPKRVKPACPQFYLCGGCSLMHMDYAEQLNFKRQKVQNNLKKIGGVDAEVLPTAPSANQLNYRNKLSLPVRGEAGNVQIGLYRKGSHNLVDTKNCLLGEWCADVVKILRNYLNDQRIVPYDEKTFSGQVRHLVARFVNGQLLVTVVTNGKQKFDLSPLANSLQKKFSKFGLFLNENNNKNNVILGQNSQYVCGLTHICGEHLGVKFHLRPDSFFQVNDQIKDEIYSEVKRLLDVSETQILVDCFSGVGILTTVLASPNYQTFAVEIVPQAVEDARENAALNNSPNVTNICGDANAELPKIASRYADKTLSLVVDPPRKGLGEKICQTILHSKFDNIVYISCDSATLARDLKLLAQQYNIDFVRPYDMFPQTAEVETVVHMKRK